MTEDVSSQKPYSVHVLVTGCVQGVCYRAWTAENARRLGLSGWVRNRRDGAVEAVFCGPADRVEDMVARCRQGPPAARVEGVEMLHQTGDGGSGFEIRRDG